MQQTVATFYRFAELNDCKQWEERLRESCKTNSVLGTIILAHEGINGTISGSRKGVREVLDFIRSDARFSDLPHRECETTRNSFYRLRIIVRPEIVSFGDSSVNPGKGAGKYVDPAEWNELIQNPDMTVIDVRNDYEIEMGTFQEATDPGTTTFGEWKSYVEGELTDRKERPVAMFCTGGIRCEKASAHLLSEGFKEVYHLKGGILSYLEQVKPEDSLWKGECFVFDHRVSVTHGLEEGKASICYGCRMPLATEDKESSHYEDGVSCPRCAKGLDEKAKASRRARHRQQMLALRRGERHIGQIFDQK